GDAAHVEASRVAAFDRGAGAREVVWRSIAANGVAPRSAGAAAEPDANGDALAAAEPDAKGDAPGAAKGDAFEATAEPVDRDVGREVDEALAADVDVVVVAQEVLDHRLPVDEGAVGAAEVLEERVGEDRDHRRVLARHGRIRQAYVVVRAPSDRKPLLVER